jgi:hypothetical protein
MFHILTVVDAEWDQTTAASKATNAANWLTLVKGNIPEEAQHAGNEPGHKTGIVSRFGNDLRLTLRARERRRPWTHRCRLRNDHSRLHWGACASRMCDVQRVRMHTTLSHRITRRLRITRLRWVGTAGCRRRIVSSARLRWKLLVHGRGGRLVVLCVNHSSNSSHTQAKCRLTSGQCRVGRRRFGHDCTLI